MGEHRLMLTKLPKFTLVRATTETLIIVLFGVMEYWLAVAIASPYLSSTHPVRFGDLSGELLINMVRFLYSQGT